MTKLAASLTSVGLTLIALSAFAQTPPPTFHAVRATAAPRIDGDLSDAAWQNAEPITNFTQRDPEEGKPATEPTSVRIVYDDDAIYFGARLDDSKPVTTRLGRRDTSIESDYFRIYLDPYLDRRTGVSFMVNPANVQLDTALSIDTSSDSSWDAVWESATKVDAKGWSVEVRIPFSQLRFQAKDEQTWGINLVRYISRRSESARAVHIPKKESGFVSRMGTLTGIRDIKPKRTIEVLPFLVGKVDSNETIDARDPLNDHTEPSADAGVDVKVPLSSNLTLTGTINPDFGQVEVDPARVNLTAFELFFPEKRPFFLEGSSLFSFGSGVSNHVFNFDYSQPDFFYSRRIGRAPQSLGFLDGEFVDAPEQTTILGAAKITGKVNGWTIAALDALTSRETAQTRNPNGIATIEPRTNYFVARTAKDLGANAAAGFLFTSVNRDSEGQLIEPLLRENAYSLGTDGYRTFKNNAYVLQWMAGATRVDGSASSIARTQRSSARYYQRPDADSFSLDPSRTSLDGYTGRVLFVKHAGKFQFNLQTETISPGFESNDIGFMTRSDIVATHAVALYDAPQPWKATRSRFAWIGKFQHWNYDGDLIFNGVNFDSSVVWMNYLRSYFWGGAELEAIDDRATRGGPVIRRAGSHWLGGQFGTDSRKKLTLDLTTEQGRTDEDGFDNYYSTAVSWKPTSRLSLRFSPNYRDTLSRRQYVRTVVDPTATSTFGARYVFSDLHQKVLETPFRFEYTFTSRLSLQLYVQPYVATGDYDDFKEVVAPRSSEFTPYPNVAYDASTDRYTIDPDGSGSAAAFSFRDPDFNYRSVRGNAVLRWEFRPGSSLYVVWNDNREDELPTGDFRLRRDIASTFDAPGRDVFLVKVSYWLPL